MGTTKKESNMEELEKIWLEIQAELEQLNYGENSRIFAKNYK